ncbi:MAG TPA: hypothetical protein VE964_07505, partial [Myxococcales bacterium]|nr:hypothetical protein [Myxococcales bacterium]
MGASDEFTIDLVSLRWIEALPLAVLAALMRAHDSTGGQGTIVIPKRYEFLQRMNLFRVVGATMVEKFKR